jgi:hypothetical protein
MKKGTAKQAELSLHIFKDPASTEGCEGQQLQLSVTAYPSNLTYSWRKGGVPINPLEARSTLTFPAFTAANAGDYDCVVTLGLKKKTSSTATVVARDKPVITSQPGPVSQSLSPGATISYSMAASGAGTLTYQWEHRPNVPFAPFVDIPGEIGTTLVITNITSSDGGTYRCKVTNECGFTRTRNCGVIVLN